MTVAVGCLLIALACQDVDRVAAPTPAPPIATVAASPPVLLSLTCTLSRGLATVACIAARPSAAAGVSASVIYGATATYAIFFPYNLVKDTVAHTWAFTAYLQNLLWKFSVPNTVTAVSMSILISMDFPAEWTVLSVPPDTEPAWFSADSNWNGAQMKRVISLAFKSGTTLADRQLAVAYVGGTIVGGAQGDGDEGGYLLSIASDGSVSASTTAMNRLSSLPQVDFAVETARAAPR